MTIGSISSVQRPVDLLSPMVESPMAAPELPGILKWYEHGWWVPGGWIHLQNWIVLTKTTNIIRWVHVELFGSCTKNEWVLVVLLHNYKENIDGTDQNLPPWLPQRKANLQCQCLLRCYYSSCVIIHVWYTCRAFQYWWVGGQTPYDMIEFW